MIPAIRVGQGIDVHAVADDPTRPLVIGGVRIPDARGLAGHSDADVALHAVVDAVLGAAGAGDLGTLVGVDLPETAGADSAGFVRAAVDLVGRDGWVIGNVDVTVIAQRPRLGGHRVAMQDRIAELLGVGAGHVSVKATTTDRLGVIGRGEGIAALAVVLLVASS